MFWGNVTVNKGDRPPSLNKLLTPGSGISPTMKAVQYWGLLRYLPLAVGKFIPTENKYWACLLHLCHLVDLLFSLNFTPGMVTYMKDVIEDHLSKFS